MKRKDLIWIGVIILISFFVFSPWTNPWFEKATSAAPYRMGFLKTMLLASMGEMLVKRIKTGYYTKDKGLFLKGIVWGFLGMLFVFVFSLFDGGVRNVLNHQILFQNETLNQISYALIISISMNILFAPTFMLLHRVTDTYIDLSKGSIKKLYQTPLSMVVDHIDFKFFFSFVLLKTIPFFWIPAHTITFILPATYRVLMASYLSIALGILLSIKKKETSSKS